MTMNKAEGAAATTASGNHPIDMLTWRMEAAQKRADKFDKWTRDPANDDAWDWEWHYQEMRRERRRVRRLHIGILRMQLWLYGEDANTLAALARVSKVAR